MARLDGREAEADIKADIFEGGLSAEQPAEPPSDLIPADIEPDTEERLPPHEPTRLTEKDRRGLEMIELGLPVPEAAKLAGLAPATLWRVRRSELGTAFIALLEQERKSMLRGMLWKAAAVLSEELKGKDRLRAAEMVFKHLGHVIGVGEAAGVQKANATATARALLEQAGLLVVAENAQINVGKSEREV